MVVVARRDLEEGAQLVVSPLQLEFVKHELKDIARPLGYLPSVHPAPLQPQQPQQAQQLQQPQQQALPQQSQQRPAMPQYHAPPTTQFQAPPDPRLAFWRHQQQQQQQQPAAPSQPQAATTQAPAKEPLANPAQQ